MANHGRYSIVRKIAEGGMAEIYLADMEGTHGFRKPVVLKSIRTAFYADPHFRTMLIDEAHISMSLNHGNIVQILDLGEASGRYFLALELVDGWSLDQLLRRSEEANHPLPPELALFIGAQTCRALGYAHGMTRQGEPLGIVHRDVSPQNILISEQGEVKLSDFGIAKALTKQGQTAAGVVKGKLAFMSPEQAQASPLDGRSDLFSLGTVLYLVTTGKLPFNAPTPIETMVRIKAATFPPPGEAKPGLHPELCRVLVKAMRLEPKDRYRTAQEMLLDLEKVMRTAFHPVGQTELQQWLQALGEKDQVPPISRQPAAQEPSQHSSSEHSLSGVVELSSSSLLSPTLQSPGVRQSNIPPPLPRQGKGLRAAVGVGLLFGAAAGGLYAVREKLPGSLQAKLPEAWRTNVEGSPEGTGPAALAPPSESLQAAVGLETELDAGLPSPPLLAAWPGAPAPGAAPSPAGPDGGAPSTVTSAAPLAAADGGTSPASTTQAALLALASSPSLMDGGLASPPVGEEGNEEDEERLLQAAVPNATQVVIGQNGEVEPDDADASPDGGLPGLALSPDTPPIPATTRSPESAPTATAAATPARATSSTRSPSTRGGAAQGKPGTVSVLVQSYPAGAVVRIDSQVFGRTPIPLRFKSGILYELTFVKAGYETTSKRIFVENRQNQKATAYLRKAGARKRVR